MQRPGAISRRLLFACLAAQLLGGCSSNEYLVVRKAPRNPLAVSLRLLSRSGPQPTERTQQIVRRFGLSEDASEPPEQLLAGLQRGIAEEPSAEKIYAFAELAYISGNRAARRGQDGPALDFFGAAVAYAYLYLFDPAFTSDRNPFDPRFRHASELYNASLESALRILNRRELLEPGTHLTIFTGRKEFRLQIRSHGRWRVEDYDRIEFVSDYEVVGLRNRHYSYGLGVPLIAIHRTKADPSGVEKYYPPGLSFPITAFLHVTHDPRGYHQSGVHYCTLELYDPLVAEAVMVGDRRVPLETDLSTPLAFALDNPSFRRHQNVATLGFVLPSWTQEQQGLYMVEPYDPTKIPVLMVHGLWSSPLTWMEMFNDLRAFPEIRKNYQFWFYQYPTGQPLWISAAQFREDLDEMRRLLDPRGQFPAMHQMVLVGHSMGGLMAELQTLDSGDDFWQLISHEPFATLNAPPAVADRLAQLLYFQRNPSIRRVVSIATPHDGSHFSNRLTRFLARQVIQYPSRLWRLNEGLLRENPGVFHNMDMLTINTSIDSLAPDSPFLEAMARRRHPLVRYHNVVGQLPDESIWQRLAGQSDGVVKFASAHLEQAASEVVVPADHMNVHNHPRSILEVRRVLVEHLGELVASGQLPLRR